MWPRSNLGEHWHACVSAHVLCIKMSAYWSSLIMRIMKSTSNSQNKIDQNFPLYVWVKQTCLSFGSRAVHQSVCNWSSLIVRNMKSTSNSQSKIDQSFPLYVWVKQTEKLFRINYFTSTQQSAEKNAPRHCKVAHTCKQGPATSERLTRPLRKGVFQCEKRFWYERAADQAASQGGIHM